MKYYMLIGAGLLLSCTASKLKTKYSTKESVSIANDSSLSETSWRGYMAEDQSEYNALWWLKGNARWHPDSGLTADELWIRYRGRDERSVHVLDSQGRLLEGKKVMQQEASSQFHEKQKEKSGLFRLPWWVYVILLVGVYFFMQVKGKKR